MFDLNSLPVSGGAVLTGITSVALFGFVLGPLVAERTIQNADWPAICVARLNATNAATPTPSDIAPSVNCTDLMGVFGQEADQVCEHGGNALFDLLTLDPLAGQKEHHRRGEAARLSRIAELAPSRCSCASSVVASERLDWGLYAGSARLIGGPDDLKADLTTALHSPTCTRLGEG